jgi:hypothetical protein
MPDTGIEIVVLTTGTLPDSNIVLYIRHLPPCGLLNWLNISAAGQVEVVQDKNLFLKSLLEEYNKYSGHCKSNHLCFYLILFYKNK